MEPVCMAGSHANDLPTPTHLTKIQTVTKTYCFGASQKSASLVRSIITIESVTRLHVHVHGGLFLKNVLIFEIVGDTYYKILLIKLR